EYPRTNVYILSHEKTGLWIGASPETLVKVNDGKFKTMALAGSKLEYQEWSDKEKEEQKIVADYITNILEGYNFEKLRIKGVQTVSAGPIQHLRTHYEAPIGENDPMEIAEKLHPTPAVCGVPTDLTKQYLKDNEGYNRELYTGFIGVKHENNFDSFVNLRCMRIYNDRIQLFAGGGITAESRPEIEWNETQTKIQTLMRVIKEVREE
ncbi:MAG: chorismate-binding protein, partial [Schleiferiaceae bacterium]|nr:chorismate-binding protein [Schleiferiaceae bacterium]